MTGTRLLLEPTDRLRRAVRRPAVRRIAVVAGVQAAAAAALAAPALANGEDAPAGGAAVDHIIYATAGAGVGLALLALFVFRHRTSDRSIVGRLAERMEASSGIPGWAILPIAALTVSLLTAVFGMYWDISIHIDKGRDPGPLANPAHYFILVGLFGVMASGVLAITLPKQKPGSAAVRLPMIWPAPVGGILMAVCGGFALLGFPLDDAWHRIFGQDVTLYSPTHLMLISGASLSTLAGWMLLVEGRRTVDVVPERAPPSCSASTRSAWPAVSWPA